jgi:uncharacterized damage-inducible protein DinB
MAPTRRPGALGALIDEYERAARDLSALLERLGDDEFTRILDPDTADEDCRSIQAITHHVVRSGYGYMNRIRPYFDLPKESPATTPPTLPEAKARFAKMLEYSASTFEGRWTMTDPEITKLTTLFGPFTIDAELLLEHAIVHILRHRRQIEKLRERGN